MISIHFWSFLKSRGDPRSSPKRFRRPTRCRATRCSSLSPGIARAMRISMRPGGGGSTEDPPKEGDLTCLYGQICICIYIYTLYIYMYVYIHVCECELLSKSFIIHLSSSYYRLSFFSSGGAISLSSVLCHSRFTVLCVTFAFGGCHIALQCLVHISDKNSCNTSGLQPFDLCI
jgi:hypothetical protein